MANLSPKTGSSKVVCICTVFGICFEEGGGRQFGGKVDTDMGEGLVLSGAVGKQVIIGVLVLLWIFLNSRKRTCAFRFARYADAGSRKRRRCDTQIASINRFTIKLDVMMRKNPKGEPT